MTDLAPYPPVDGTQPCTAEPEAFFPAGVPARWALDGHAGASRTRVSGDEYDAAVFALELCGSCPFRRPCLAYALTHAVEGIWGGTTTQQRMDLRKQHHITAAPIALTDTTLLAIDVDRFDRGGGLPLQSCPSASE